MAFDLDQPENYQAIDRQGMIQNIADWPDQIISASKAVDKLVLPSHYLQLKNVVLLGMGGSAMGNDLVKALAGQHSKLPIEVYRDYDLPKFVDSHTLTVATSYSGKTEETLSAFEHAAKRGSKLICISSGGQLESLSRKYRCPFFKINYGAQPRAALGWSLTALLGIFTKLDLVELTRSDLAQAVSMVQKEVVKNSPDVPTVRNPAKQLAQRIVDKIPIIYGSGPLAPVARRYKGQFNENAKQTSYFEILPELNHNSVVGTQFPEIIRKNIIVVLLASQFDNPRNKTRVRISAQILQKRKIEHQIVGFDDSPSSLSEMLRVIVFGDYTSYYCALLNGVDPEPVEIIDFLKSQLTKS